jgi:serine kinase of HPr protein (carbohydrate metabolism regulator)
MTILHAGLVAMRRQQHWVGALVAGPSGVGKSDLMLRALDLGLRLVADDRTLVWASDGRLFGRAPETICGLFEARGLGLVQVPALAFAEIRLIVDCEPPETAIARMPLEDDSKEIASLRIPRLRLHAFEASAPAKLRLALSRR